MRAEQLRDPARIFRLPARRTSFDPAHEDFDADAACEAAVLGAVMVRNARYFECVREGLTAQHFASELNGRLWRAMGEMIEAGLQASPVTLMPCFADDEDYRQQGGHAYLGALAAQSAGVIGVRAYARRVCEASTKRGFMALAELARAHACDGQGDLDAARSELQQVLDDCQPSGSTGGMIPFAQALDAAEQANERARVRGTVDGVPFGLADLDRLTGGAAKSDLVIVAGRPGMGKSALGLCIALHNARQGRQVAFFTLEMTATQMANRAIALHSRVSADELRRGEVEAEQAQAARQVKPGLAQLALHFNQDSTIDLARLRAAARRLKDKHGLDLIVIDYVQLIAPAGNERSRVEEIAAITVGLKNLAKTLDVPVIALAQLNRAPEQREDRRPQLADLRESGTIEQDADTVILLYREHYYLMRQEPRERDGDAHRQWEAKVARSRDQAELIVAKNRHGAYGTVVVRFNGPAMAFSDLPGSGGPARSRASARGAGGDRAGGDRAVGTAPNFEPVDGL
jgi:replicative DNA helicase